MEERGAQVFTEEETRLTRLWSLGDVSAGRQVFAQVAYFATPAVLGIYGLATGSRTVLGVAFIVVLLLLAWGFVSTWRDRKNALLIQSVFRKISAGLPAGDGKP